jgi:hypothetical protein
MSIMVDQLPGWESRPCKGTNPVLWFGPPEPDEPGGFVESQARREWREGRVRAICRSCPFGSPCLEAEMALPPRDMWGFRAGLTAEERRDLRERLRRRRAAAVAAA